MAILLYLRNVKKPKLLTQVTYSSLFTDEYYFRPRVAWRFVRQAMFDSGERRRLYKEAREYLALRSKRKRFVRQAKAG